MTLMMLMTMTTIFFFFFKIKFSALTPGKFLLSIKRRLVTLQEVLYALFGFFVLQNMSLLHMHAYVSISLRWGGIVRDLNEKADPVIHCFIGGPRRPII